MVYHSHDPLAYTSLFLYYFYQSQAKTWLY
jgi:hypothetical protein